jgi:hypothetical protein
MAKKKPSRAELLRDKRNQRSRKSSSSSPRRSKSAAKSIYPPILVRGEVAASASRSRSKGKKIRRRYDIALNGSGAEMRLPSLPTIAVGWRLLSGLLVVLLGFLIYTLWYSPYFTISGIEVSGLVRLTNQELNAVADVIGKSIVLVSPSDLERDLKIAFPQLAEVSVETNIPNEVIVKVVERQPVLAWQQEGQTFWIDADGTAFLSEGEGGPQITVHGPDMLSMSPPNSESLDDAENAASSLPLELVSAILAINKDVPEGVSIMYDSRHGLGWQDQRGWQVYFGHNDEDIDMKLRVYNKTWKRLKKAGIRPALINVEHVHAPYYRLER